MKNKIKTQKITKQEKKKMQDLADALTEDIRLNDFNNECSAEIKTIVDKMLEKNKQVLGFNVTAMLKTNDLCSENRIVGITYLRDESKVAKKARKK